MFCSETDKTELHVIGNEAEIEGGLFIWRRSL